MSAANVEQGGRGRPGPWRVAGAAALASLGVIVLVGAVRYERPAGETAAAEVSAEPASPSGPAEDLPALPDPPATPGPTPTPTAVPSATGAKPPAPALATAPIRPSASRTPAAGPKAPAPAATSRGPAVFSPISVQAEDPDNTVSGGAAVTSCATCDGGARVRYLGRVVVYVDIPSAGNRTVTVTYESDGTRELKVAVGGSAVYTFDVGGTSWAEPRTLRFTTALPAGRVAIALYNDTSPPPDVDKVTIS